MSDHDGGRARVLTALRRNDGAAAHLAVLVGIVVVAAALRLVLLAEQPGGLFEDEAAEGLDAWRLVHVPGFHPLFFDDDGGREAIFAYLVSGVFRITGASVLALRATSAVLGILAVAATPLLLRRLGRAALLGGTAWAAVSAWLVSVDRDGMRNSTVPLVATLAMAALVAWSARPSRGRAALAGALCGAGLWTYQPLKLLPVVVALWLLWLARRRSPAWPGLRRTLAAAGVAYVVVALPIVAVAVTDPSGYFGRAGSVTLGDAGARGGDLVVHTLRTLGMFGLVGDPNARHDAGAIPLVPALMTVLLVAGAARAWRLRDRPECTLLLVGLPVFLLPPLVATEGSAPHGLRALGLAPVIAGLVGLGSAAVVGAAGRLGRGPATVRVPVGPVEPPRPPRPPGSAGASAPWHAGAAVRARRVGATTAAAAAVCAVFALTGAETATAYFDRGVADRYDAYAFDLVALAQAAEPGSVVVLDDYRSLTVRFIDRDAPPHFAAPGSRLQLRPGTVVLARDLGELRTAVGPVAAGRAAVIARDPSARPVVWRVTV